MRKSSKITLIMVAVFIIIGLIFYKFYSLGYEFAQSDKYPDIPEFPNIVGDEFENIAIDTLRVDLLKKYRRSDRYLLAYTHPVKDLQDSLIKVAITSPRLKSLATFEMSRPGVCILKEKRNRLLIINKPYSESQTFCKLYDATTGIGIPFTLLKNINHYNQFSENLTVVCKSMHVLIFADDRNNWYVALHKIKDLIQESFTENLPITPDDPIDIKLFEAGDFAISHKNINLFDKVVYNVESGTLFHYPTPSSQISIDPYVPPPNEGYDELAEDQESWFRKDRCYYFDMKLKNRGVRFKTYMYYGSGNYFYQFNIPKSDSDTLWYYNSYRIYRFNKKHSN
jgi:hypothetical protein